MNLLSNGKFEIGYQRAEAFDNDAYVYVSDSQDLESLHHNLPVCPDGMTGAFVVTEDGDYVEVWVTESSRPYAINAIYERIV